MRHLVMSLLVAAVAYANVEVSRDGKTYTVDKYGRKPSREELSITEPQPKLISIRALFDND